MEKSEKFMLIIAVIALMVNCVYLDFRVNELESRISTVERDYSFISKNLKETVNLASELVMRISEDVNHGEK
ncbi:MAG: hypothetical protein J6M62_02470 [Selenomonadaceae bacterium]|nr:hypothetical protein [Selenomonadaceae bacterium]MBP3723790.1 hypothetical protein [Selenomonadaceae bacterium]